MFSITKGLRGPISEKKEVYALSVGATIHVSIIKDLEMIFSKETKLCIIVFFKLIWPQNPFKGAPYKHVADH